MKVDTLLLGIDLVFFVVLDEAVELELSADEAVSESVSPSASPSDPSSSEVASSSKGASSS